MAGILALSTVPVLGLFGMLVEDTADGRIDSFKVAPIARGVIMFGHLVSAWVVAAVLSGIALMLSQIYIYIAGGELLTSHQYRQDGRYSCPLYFFRF